MTVDQLRPGMKGIGRSVFSGTEVKEFDAEVVDIIRQVWPRGDLILCRLSGQGLEESGVVAGMSGSPVYIDGRLIGAVAYAWPFAKQPLAGVTPAAQMLKVWDEPSRSDDRPSVGRAARPGKAEGATHGRALRQSKSGPAGLSALPIPVALTGLSSGLAQLIEPELKEFGLSLAGAAGTASSGSWDTSALVPGAAVGVALIDGDVRLSGIGTLTCRDGNRILAFGHPMLQAGAIELPMVGGVIHSVLPSVAMSFKLFSPTAPIGTIRQDRLAGIGGDIGPIPEMLPVTALVSSPSGLDTYRFRIVEHEDLSPMLAAVGLTNVVYQTEGNLEEATLDSRLTVRFASPAGRNSEPNTDSLVIRHTFSGVNPAADLFRAVKKELGLIFGNRFLPAPIAGIGIAVDLGPGRSTSYLLAARPDRTQVRPGDTFNLTLILRDFRGGDSELTVAVSVPRAAPTGRLRLLIAAPESLLALEAMRAPAKLEPGSLADLLALLSQTGRENELAIVGYSTRPGLTLANRELPSPPPSLRSVLLHPRSGEPVMATTESQVLSQSLQLGRVIAGTARVELEVRE